MTSIDLIGWAAAGTTLLAYTSRDGLLVCPGASVPTGDGRTLSHRPA